MTGVLEILHRRLIQTDEFTVFGHHTWVAPEWFIYLLTGGEDGLFKLLGFDQGRIDNAVTLTLFLGFILLTQWLFLLPRRHWRVRLAQTGRPMGTSVLTAALMATLLSVGMGATLLDLSSRNWLEQIGSLTGFYTILLVLWLLWTIVFFLYWRSKDRLTRLSWMLNCLITGSIIDLFVAIGVYAWNPQQDDCWCARGAYTGLVLGATVMIWVFGPGVLLLFLHRQQIQKERNNNVS